MVTLTAPEQISSLQQELQLAFDRRVIQSKRTLGYSREELERHIGNKRIPRRKQIVEYEYKSRAMRNREQFLRQNSL